MVTAAHCVKSVRIRSYSGLHFRAFGLNTGRYSVSHGIQSKCVKMRARITRNTDILYAVVAPVDLMDLALMVFTIITN